MTKKKSAKTPQNWWLIATNYVGGLGYYALLFGAAILLVLFAMSISQFVIVEGTVVEPTLSENAAPAPEETGGSVWLTLASLPFIALVIVMVAVLPYGLGKYTQRAAKWVVKNSPLDETVGSLLKVKLTAAALLVLLATIGVFGFYRDAQYNVPSYIIYTSGVLATAFFLGQFALASYRKFAYRDIF